MASVPVVIVGTIKDNDGSDEKQVTITGMASIAGLGVGGGPVGPPVYPAHPIAPGGPPPHVEHPIPPAIWPTPPQPPWYPGHPAHPIPPVVWPNPPGEGDKPPLFDWQVVWHPEEGWVVAGVPNFEHPTPSK